MLVIFALMVMLVASCNERNPAKVINEVGSTPAGQDLLRNAFQSDWAANGWVLYDLPPAGIPEELKSLFPVKNWLSDVHVAYPEGYEQANNAVIMNGIGQGKTKKELMAVIREHVVKHPLFREIDFEEVETIEGMQVYRFDVYLTDGRRLLTNVMDPELVVVPKGYDGDKFIDFSVVIVDDSKTPR